MRRNKKVNLLMGRYEQDENLQMHFVDRNIVEIDAYVFEYEGVRAFIHKYQTDYWQGNEFLTSMSFSQRRKYSKTGKDCIEFIKKIIDKRKEDILKNIDKFLKDNDPINE